MFIYAFFILNISSQIKFIVLFNNLNFIILFCYHKKLHLQTFKRKKKYVRNLSYALNMMMHGTRDLNTCMKMHHARMNLCNMFTTGLCHAMPAEVEM